MTVGELRNILGLMPEDKEVFIQQGEDFDYMTVYSVKQITLSDEDESNLNDEIDAVVIKYQ